MRSGIRQNSIVTLVTLFLLTAIITDVSIKLGGDIPALPPLTTKARPTIDSQASRRIESLFDRLPIEKLTEASPNDSAFFTRYFEPAPAPPKPPPPPPKPKTKKYQITFQGFYTTSAEDQKAFILINDTFKSLRVGETVIDDLILMELDKTAVMIGNAEIAPKRIEFQKTGTLEIPE